LTNLSLTGVEAPASTIAEAGEIGFWGSVAKIPTLKVLVVSDVRLMELTDKIEALSQLPNLEDLRLTYANLTDIAPLSGLTQLKSLSLYGNDIADFSPLTALKQLNSLTISGNRRAMSYGFLSSLNQLQLFDASYISGVSGALAAILNSTQLQHLNLSDANMSLAASQLNVLADLRQLHLRGNPVTGVVSLNLPKLEFLDLVATGISTFPTITSPIKTLLLGNNSLADASAIGNLVSLVSIDLSKNQLTSLPTLESLTELENLRFDENSVAVLPELGNKPKLRLLSAKQNLLSDASSIHRVTGIVGASFYLDLSLNPLPLDQQVCPTFTTTCKY
jgi:Leucine-rich repeat (LRR) protein